MTRSMLVVLALVLTLAPRPSVAGAELDPILGRFLGVWRTETLIRAAGPPLRERRTFGRAAGRVLLDGYVEFRTTSIDPPGLSEVQVMTYDPEARVYRRWVSDSDGYRHEAIGRWDPATATLTWRGAAGGASFVIEDRWVSRDRLERTLTRTSADGQVVQEIQGVVTRSSRSRDDQRPVLRRSASSATLRSISGSENPRSRSVVL